MSYEHMQPGRVTPQVKRPEDRKKIGILAAKPMSQHTIHVRPADGAPLQTHIAVARPFESVPDKAKKVCICMHHGCVGTTWPDEQAMRAKHPSPDEMRKFQQVHVWAYWSSDPIGTPDPECADCKKTKGGLPCAAHYGGCIGLIAPAEPKSDL